MITQEKQENEEKAKLTEKSYDTIESMFFDLKSKLQIYNKLNLGDADLSYCLAMYTDEIQIIIRAIELKVDIYRSQGI